MRAVSNTPKVSACLLLTAIAIDVSHSFRPQGSTPLLTARLPVVDRGSVGGFGSNGSRPLYRLFGRRGVDTIERIYEEANPTTFQVATCNYPTTTSTDPVRIAATTALATVTAAAASSQALAASIPEISQGYLDPSNFNPVCPASDFFYRALQSSAINVVGRESFIEYGPLIAGGLLRVRLELCVVESFFNEAVIPFIRQNGLNWVLPLHETVETFLAGTVFAIATTFILIGSTKILIVIATYTDFLIGLPFRLFGGFAYDRAMGKPVTLDIGLGPFKTRIIGPPDKEGGVNEKDFADLGPAEVVSVVLFGTAKFAGQVVGFVRDGLDTLDVFVGRYLVLWASLYIGLKFLHFKVFPDFP